MPSASASSEPSLYIKDQEEKKTTNTNTMRLRYHKISKDYLYYLFLKPIVSRENRSHQKHSSQGFAFQNPREKKKTYSPEGALVRLKIKIHLKQKHVTS